MNAPFEIRVWHELSSYRRVYQLRQGTRNVEAYLTDEDLEAGPYRTQREWNEYIANKLCTLWYNAFDEKVQAIPPSHEGTAWAFRYKGDVVDGEVVDGDVVEGEVIDAVLIVGDPPSLDRSPRGIEGRKE